MFSLNNKISIVTGAASGLGKEIAMLFAKQGAKVVAVDYNQKSLDAFVAFAKSQEFEVLPILADISKKEDVERIFSTTLEKYHSIDILINNAGVMDKLDPVGSLTDEIFDKVININLKGTFLMMRESLKTFQSQKRGVIVNIASVAGIKGGRAGAAYTASKHGVIGLSKNTAHFYAKSGIRCNVVAPGGMKTNIMSGNIDLSSAGRLLKAMFTSQGNQKTADASQVASVALFLASDEANFVNGAVVVADGGWSAY